MSKKRQKLQEAVRGRYTPIPHELLDSQKFIGLSHIAKALLFDALRQHNGRNNGHIQLSMGWLTDKRGWGSRATIQKATKELVSAGLLSVTHAGGLNRGATLYGFTWLDVTDYKGLDIPVGQFVKGGWRDAAEPLKPDAVIADAPASENYKERTATWYSAVPPRGTANSLPVPPRGTETGVFDHSTVPPRGNYETVAIYPTLKSSSVAVRNERKERAQLTVTEPAAQNQKAKSRDRGEGCATRTCSSEKTKGVSENASAREAESDFALLPTEPDEPMATDKPEPTKMGRKDCGAVESLPLPF